MMIDDSSLSFLFRGSCLLRIFLRQQLVVIDALIWHLACDSQRLIQDISKILAGQAIGDHTASRRIT
jgi:hypothetical protein